MSKPRKNQPRKSNSCEPLFGRWRDIRERVRQAGQIRLFLDFDGTLVGFRPLPHQVRLSPAARKALAKLASHKRVRAAIISGRRRDDLSQYVRVPGLELFGLYGWDRRERTAQLPARTLRKLSQARERLAKVPAGLPGVFIEDKGMSLAVHFRSVSAENRRRVQLRVRGLMRRLAPELHLLRSSTTWEVAPRQMGGKGAALQELLGGVRNSYLPIYVGDDWTDEPAFAALRKGITVLVGPKRKTKATYRLGGCAAVVTFLKRLAAEIE